MLKTPILQLAAGVLFLASGVINILNDAPGMGWTFTVLGFAMLALGATSFTPKPHTPYSEALVAPGRGVVFWKEGCTSSQTLIRQLHKDQRLSWVNVRRGSPGDAKLRVLTGGTLSTPVLLTEDRVLRNPNAEQVAAALR